MNWLKFLNDPSIKTQDHSELSRTMKKITHKSDAVLHGLLDYLTETGEERLLPEVTKSLENVIQRSKKSDEIRVTSAIQLESFQLAELSAIIKKILKIDLPVINTIDKKLIGGFTVQINDWFWDASIRHQLEFLKRSLLS